jgi:hypothetical protein
VLSPALSYLFTVFDVPEHQIALDFAAQTLGAPLVL